MIIPATRIKKITYHQLKSAPILLRKRLHLDLHQSNNEIKEFNNSHKLRSWLPFAVVIYSFLALALYALARLAWSFF